MFSNLFYSKSDKYRDEFVININSINVSRAKITSLIFIVIESAMLMITFITRKSRLLEKTNLYYTVMYLLFLCVMIIYHIIFKKLGDNISENGRSIQLAGIFFVSSILLWCAGISLLDQLSSGQIIVYTVAIIAVAVTPVLEPQTLLFIYIIVQSLFLILMPHFQKSAQVLFQNYINSSTFIIISWSISCMRYKRSEDDFNNEKIIQEKSEELKRLNKELDRLSQIDGLTGIYNRLAFDRSMKDEWDKCKIYNIPLSLIMIDIDFFKAFNDNYGHQAGDDCLRQVSKVLSSCARRSSDIVARYGGEEFVVILPYMEKEDALKLAENMRRNVEQLSIPHMYSPVSQYVTISAGVYTGIPYDESSAEEFIKIADKALYEAKERRNNVVAEISNN